MVDSRPPMLALSRGGHKVGTPITVYPIGPVSGIQPVLWAGTHQLCCYDTGTHTTSSCSSTETLGCRSLFVMADVRKNIRLKKCAPSFSFGESRAICAKLPRTKQRLGVRPLPLVGAQHKNTTMCIPAARVALLSLSHAGGLLGNLSASMHGIELMHNRAPEAVFLLSYWQYYKK